MSRARDLTLGLAITHRWMHLSMARGVIMFAIMFAAFIPLLMAMRRPPE